MANLQSRTAVRANRVQQRFMASIHVRFWRCSLSMNRCPVVADGSPRKSLPPQRFMVPIHVQSLENFPLHEPSCRSRGRQSAQISSQQRFMASIQVQFWRCSLSMNRPPHPAPLRPGFPPLRAGGATAVGRLEIGHYPCALWSSLVGNLVESVQQGNRCLPITNSKFMRKHDHSAACGSGLRPDSSGLLCSPVPWLLPCTTFEGSETPATGRPGGLPHMRLAAG